MMPKILFRLSCLPAIALLLVVASVAQSSPAVSSAAAEGPAAPPLHYDVVSIRRNMSGGRQMTRQSAANTDDITMTNVPLALAVFYAYRINDQNLISGLPDWTWSERYDIVAKVDPADLAAYRALTSQQRSAMFRAVLADRCKLQAHRETQDRPVYALVVAKGGPKLKEAVPGEAHPNTAKADAHAFAHGGRIFVTGPEQLTGEAATMADLSLALSDMAHESLGKRVVDRSGLAGTYDFTLQLGPQGAASEQGDAQQQADWIFEALEEQLGLKLQPAMAATESLVVDHIERPSAN